jgi:hypothetical protein
MPIQDVVFEPRGIDHEDARRALMTIFNGDLGDFVARQVKIARVKQDSVLGGHYHDYRELFYLLAGQAQFDLKCVRTGEQDTKILVPEWRILIPPLVAHKVAIVQGSILVGLTEQQYVSAAQNDHKYDF